MATKVCKMCGEEKSVDQYWITSRYKETIYYYHTCKACKQAEGRESEQSRPRRVRATPTKVCKSCGKEKPREEFPPRRTHSANSVMARCKECYYTERNEQRATAREAEPRQLRHYRPKSHPVTGIIMKKCTQCLRELPIDQFRTRTDSRRPEAPYVTAWCKECCSLRYRAWRETDPVKTRRLNRKYYLANSEKQQEYRKRFRTKNPNYFPEKGRERRAKIANAPIVESINRQEIIERDEYRCYLCGDILDPATKRMTPKAITLDHVVPLARGGSHTADNLKVACHQCNCRKHDKLLAELDWYLGG